jgi:aminopeptidase N
MKSDFRSMGKSSQEAALNPVIPAGTDPEASQSQIQYEKGYQFLSYMEKSLGDQKFQQFLKVYLDQFMM